MNALTEHGPFTPSADGRVIYGSGDGADVILDVDGDWQNAEQRQEFARAVAESLNNQAELATLRARAERAEAERDRAVQIAKNWEEIFKEELAVNLKLMADLGFDSIESYGSRTGVEAIVEGVENLKQAAQSTIADLTGQVERLRDAIVLAPMMWSDCECECPCNCWKSEALGGNS